MGPTALEKAKQQARAPELARVVVQLGQLVNQEQITGQLGMAAGQAPGIGKPESGRSRVKSAGAVLGIAGLKLCRRFSEADRFAP